MLSTEGGMSKGITCFPDPLFTSAPGPASASLSVGNRKKEKTGKLEVNEDEETMR